VRWLLLLVFGGVLVVGVALVAGLLSHDSKALGCVGEASPSGEAALDACAPGRGLGDPFGIAVSSDGKSAYVASQQSNSVAMLDREPSTGALHQSQGRASCIAQGREARRSCRPGRGLGFATDVAVSPDGRNAYVVSLNSDALAVFDRDPAIGVLRQKQGARGCVAQSGLGGACRNGEALENPSSVVVSPDGRNVYVGANGIAVFRRNPLTGDLKQEKGGDGCRAEENRGGACRFAYATDLAISPNGKDVYVTSPSREAIAIFARDARTGALKQLPGRRGCISQRGANGRCGKAHALSGADHIAVSPDGANVYVSAKYSESVAIFDRDPKTGALAQKRGVAGCISQSGSQGTCEDGRGLRETGSIAVSPDGSNVYVLGEFSDELATFDRRVGGDLVQLAGAAGCISAQQEPGCGNTTVLEVPTDLTVSPDGKNVYVLASFQGVVAAFDRSSATGRLTLR
jgi:DNA-binding beta-propeller fold protein YncE